MFVQRNREDFIRKPEQKFFVGIIETNFRLKIETIRCFRDIKVAAYVDLQCSPIKKAMNDIFKLTKYFSY